MLCRSCGVEVSHQHRSEAGVGGTVQGCPSHRGAIWVEVTGDGTGVGDVEVRVAGQTKRTDAVGLVSVDPLDDGVYEVEVVSVPQPRRNAFELPHAARSPATVQTGEITFVRFALAPVVAARMQLAEPVAVVGGPRVKLTLGAEPTSPEGCTGTLRVTQGTDRIRLVRSGAALTLNGGAVTMESVPAGGLDLEIEAVDASELEGVKLQWTLESATHRVSGDAVGSLTVAKVELVAKTAAGLTLSPEVMHGAGGVVLRQNDDKTRARLQVTPRCLPAELPGQLRLTTVGDGIEIFEEKKGGEPLGSELLVDLGPDEVVPSYWLEGKVVSDAPRDNSFFVGLVGHLDEADELRLTVADVTLCVYGGTPGPSDPAQQLPEDEKRDPGRRLYQQNEDTWWWDRARVQLVKDPPDAPCSLRLRTDGPGAVRVFPETFDVNGNETPLQNHVEGEAPVDLPINLPADAIEDDEGISYWIEGQATTGEQRHELLVDIVDFEDAADVVEFRVTQPLDEYDRISVVDLGGPGSGHQAAVIKLLDGLARIGFGGEVVLTYNKRKTRIYARKFGVQEDLNDPVRSYALYHDEWNGQYPAGAAGRHQLQVRCRPVGELDLGLSGAEQRVFGENIQEFWTQHCWPGAQPQPFEEPRPAGFGGAAAEWGARHKWSGNHPRLQNNQEAWRDRVLRQDVSAVLAQYDQLLAIQPPVDRTLTAFGAMDLIAADHEEMAREDFAEAFFDRHWLPVLRRMTAEQHPAAMIFQPFLWRSGHVMQVRQDTVIDPVDVEDRVRDAGGTAVYRLALPPEDQDAAAIAAQDPVPRSVLTRARNTEIALVSAYFGGSVSQIDYAGLLRVMVRVAGRLQLAQPLVVALLGDEMRGVHDTVAAETTDGTVIARNDDAAADENVAVELVHIGRTNAMTQFQRHSSVFVTEGANTWQELLTVGTPSLSANPEGKTRPWIEPLTASGDRVREASEALIAAGRNLDDEGALQTVATFIEQALTLQSPVRQYFAEWAGLLADPRSDQVMMGVKFLPDPARLD
ncbi:MAG: hypothetical protein AAF799_30815 [Myxococcota bacterium]